MRESDFLILTVVLSTTSLIIGISIGILSGSSEVLASDLDDNNSFSYYNIPGDSYLSSFDKIVKEVAEEEYDIRKYNCKNFSQKLSQRLLDQGYQAKICQGTLRECSRAFCGHAWVKVEEIYIEATTGEIINPSEYEEGYSEKFCS
ncbi:MAG: hypothetical protein JSV92_01640 [archaeon]|nr:MAG: hypothetical protein JSV92_01640 [archaeon]